MAVYGLFDVDGTVRKQGKDGDYIDDALVDEFLEAGVRNVYLFTSTDMGIEVSQAFVTPAGPEEPGKHYPTREAVVQHLRDKGFVVHGVITAADVVYQQGLGRAYSDLLLPWMEEVFSGEIASAADLVGNSAYQAALAEWARLTKNTAPKPDMFEYFYSHRPRDCESIIYCEDGLLEVRTVEHLARVKLMIPKSRLMILKIDPNSPSLRGHYQSKILEHCQQPWGDLEEVIERREPEGSSEEPASVLPTVSSALFQRRTAMSDTDQPFELAPIGPAVANKPPGNSPVVSVSQRDDSEPSCCGLFVAGLRELKQCCLGSSNRIHSEADEAKPNTVVA